MALSIAHIINPFKADKSSDLFYAQPITFETMTRAKANCPSDMEVELLTTTFPEDIEASPSHFRNTTNLNRSVLDLHEFKQPIRLPLIHDILEKAYNEADADYIIYTNVDISLYPNFYKTVYQLIKDGHDAIIINRNRIPPKYTSVEDLDKILKLQGKSHPGFDCFVFKRDLFPKLHLENICIGVPFIEITLSQNLFHLANKFTLIESDQNTFHIGMEIFKKRAPKEYLHFNRGQYYEAMKKLSPFMKSKNLPFNKKPLPVRIIKYGMHPCIPIRLACQLELKNLWSK